MGKALARQIRRHTHPAARPEAPPPPKPSGIDYLGLVAARVAAEAARRIAYAEMGPPVPHNTTDDNAGSDESNKEVER